MKTKRLADVPVVDSPNDSGGILVNFTESDGCAVIKLSDLVDDIAFYYLYQYE